MNSTVIILMLPHVLRSTSILFRIINTLLRQTKLSLQHKKKIKKQKTFQFNMQPLISSGISHIKLHDFCIWFEVTFSLIHEREQLWWLSDTSRSVAVSNWGYTHDRHVWNCSETIGLCLRRFKVWPIWLIFVVMNKEEQDRWKEIRGKVRGFLHGSNIVSASVNAIWV